MPEVADRLTIVGRDSEIAEVAEALDAALGGMPSVLLIGGDAGIGKTALVDQLAALATERRVRVLRGACLDISANIPFRPVVEALRPLLDDLHKARAAGRIQPALGRLSDLVREGGGGSALPAGELFDLLRQCLHEASSAGPLVLAVEDMHWAEQSTRDLLTAVAGAVSGSMVIVLTYRTDDLHRRHPFRSCLVGLARLRASRRMELEPLDVAGVAALVSRRTGVEAPANHVSALLARAEGNPLYTEEILAAEARKERLPDRLSDLLMSRIEALSESTRHLMRVASVTGSRIDTELLPDLAGLTTEHVEAGLIEASDFNVVVRRGDRLEFRHGLIREAVYDGLLPDERSRLHARVAATLADRTVADGPDTLAQQSRLAYHWYAAHHLPEALAASFEAGRLALRFGAPEAAVHLDRVLALWDQVAEPSQRTGVEKTDVLRLAALVADFGGDNDRVVSLIRSALELVGRDTDPLAASRVYTTYAWVGGGGVEGLIDIEDAVDRAVSFAEHGGECREIAEALAAQADWRMRHGRFSEAERIARRAAEAADRVGYDMAECLALRVLSTTHRAFGRFDEGDAEQRAAMTVLRRAGLQAVLLREEADLAWELLLRGELERCIELGRQVTERASAAAMGAEWFLGMEQTAVALIYAGRLDEAERCLEELHASGEQPRRWRLMHSAHLLAGGHVEAATDLVRDDLLLPRPVDVLAGSPDLFEHRVALLLASGATDVALTRVRTQLDLLASEFAPMLEVVALASGFRAAAAAKADRIDLPTDLLSLLEARWQRLEGEWVTAWDSTWYGSQLLTGRAWRTRARGETEPKSWQAAVDRWAASGFHLAALALSPRLAEDLLRVGCRDEAREVLVTTHAQARRRGMQGIAEDVSALARRNRITLPGGADREPSALMHLTPREREVLDLLVAGATNRSIAEALVISQKTVSVHVSNLLAKLGATNRGQAAAIARESGAGPGGILSARRSPH